MALPLYGWGSNLHGQLRQPLHMVEFDQPVHMDNADTIIKATGSQVFLSSGDQSYYYGLTSREEDWTFIPKRNMLSWEPPRALLGNDELLSFIDNQGHICVGLEGKRQTSTRWRDAAMDRTGRVVAITGLYALLMQMVVTHISTKRTNTFFPEKRLSPCIFRLLLLPLHSIKWPQAVLISFFSP